MVISIPDVIPDIKAIEECRLDGEKYLSLFSIPKDYKLIPEVHDYVASNNIEANVATLGKVIEADESRIGIRGIQFLGAPKSKYGEDVTIGLGQQTVQAGTYYVKIPDIIRSQTFTEEEYDNMLFVLGIDKSTFTSTLFVGDDGKAARVTARIKGVEGFD